MFLSADRQLPGGLASTPFRAKKGKKRQEPKSENRRILQPLSESFTKHFRFTNGFGHLFRAPALMTKIGRMIDGQNDWDTCGDLLTTVPSLIPIILPHNHSAKPSLAGVQALAARS